LLENSI